MHSEFVQDERLKMDLEKMLETVVRDRNEWCGLQQLLNATSEFEPLAKRARLGPVIADRLVAMKLAEKGEVSGATSA